ncbi:MAG: ABC transporter substrate-binding protein [Pseudorhodoplanes sp.]
MRQLLQTIAFGLLLALTAQNAHAQKAKSDVTLRIASYGGAFDQAQARYVGVIFTLRTGIKLEWISGAPVDHIAKLIASKGRSVPFDIVYADDMIQATAINAGVVAKLDPDIVTNLKHLYDEAKQKDGYGPGISFYTVGIAYNADIFKKNDIPEPTSWADLWHPKLAGKIALPDISQSSARDLIVATARLSGGSESDTKDAFERLGKLQPLYFYRSSADLESKVVAGDAWITIWNNSRSWNLIDQGFPLKFVYPKEGGLWHLSTIDMVAGTPHPKEAQMYINQVLDPMAQLAQANEVPYGPSNKVLAPVLAAYPDLAKKFPSGPEDLKKLRSVDPFVMNREYPKWVDTWNRTVRK